MTYSPTGGFPDLTTVRDTLLISATVKSDEVLTRYMGQAQEEVRNGYGWDSYEWDEYDPDGIPDSLYEVFMRAVARIASSSGVTLGIVAADSEYGTVRLTQKDSEITRIGGAYRKRVFA